MIEIFGPRTTCAFDNLRPCMRQVYYGLMAAGVRATHMLAGDKALSAYEMITQQTDPPVTMFKDLVIGLDPSVPNDEMRFVKGGEVVGVIRHIS